MRCTQSESRGQTAEGTDDPCSYVHCALTTSVYVAQTTAVQITTDRGHGGSEIAGGLRVWVVWTRSDPLGCCPRKRELDGGGLGWRREGVVDPSPEIQVCKKVEAKHGQQV